MSLRCVLEQEINPSLVLVQPRKTHPYKTERLLMGCKDQIKQKQKISIVHEIDIPDFVLNDTLDSLIWQYKFNSISV